jgi:hypothetical protein
MMLLLLFELAKHSMLFLLFQVAKYAKEAVKFICII